MTGEELPGAIRDRSQRVAELQRMWPSAAMIETAQLMAEMLHIAVHGSTWARPETPQQVWLDLLAEVEAAFHDR
jgi:hypothetical protein